MVHQSNWASLSIFLFSVVIYRATCKVDVDDPSVCHNFNDCHFRNSPMAVTSVTETKNTPLKPPTLKWYAADQNFVNVLLRWRQENRVANSDYDLDSYTFDDLSRMTITGTSEPDRSPTERGEATLMSDLIDCRFRETGPITPRQNPDVFLSFRYWTSPLVVLHVCVLPISGNFTSIVSKPEVLLNAKCQQVNVDRGHRLASLRLPISEFNSKPFIIIITADNFLHPAGGYALVDQLELNGTCGRNADGITTTRQTQFIVPQNRTFYDQLLANAVDGPFSLEEYVHLKKMWPLKSEDVDKISLEAQVHQNPARNPPEVDSRRNNIVYFRTESNSIDTLYSTKSANNGRQIKVDAGDLVTTSSGLIEPKENDEQHDDLYFHTEPNLINTISYSNPINSEVNLDSKDLGATNKAPSEEEFEWLSNSTDDPILQLINAATLRAITGLLSYSPDRLSQEDLSEVQSVDDNVKKQLSKVEKNEDDAMDELFEANIKMLNFNESESSHPSKNGSVSTVGNILIETQEFSDNQAKTTPSSVLEVKETPIVSEWKSGNGNQKEWAAMAPSEIADAILSKPHVETSTISNNNEEPAAFKEVDVESSSPIIDTSSPHSNDFHEASSDYTKKLIEVKTGEASNKTEFGKKLIESEAQSNGENSSAPYSASDSDCKYKVSKTLVRTTSAPVVAHLQKECDCVFRRVFKVVARNLARVRVQTTSDMANNGTTDHTAPKIGTVIDNSTKPHQKQMPHSEAIDSPNEEDSFDHFYEDMEAEDSTEGKSKSKLDASRKNVQLSISSATSPSTTNTVKEEESGDVVNAEIYNNVMTRKISEEDGASESQSERNLNENHIDGNKAEQTTDNEASLEEVPTKSFNDSRLAERRPTPETANQILSASDVKKEVDDSSVNSIEPENIEGEHFSRSTANFSALSYPNIVSKTLQNRTSVPQKIIKTARDLHDKFEGINSVNDDENGTSAIKSDVSDGAVVSSQLRNFEEVNSDKIPTSERTEEIASSKFDEPHKESRSLVSSTRSQGQSNRTEYMNSVEQDHSKIIKSAELGASVKRQEVAHDRTESLETLLRMLDGRRFRVISQIFFDENGDEVKEERPSVTFQESHPPATTSDGDQSLKQQRERRLTEESSRSSDGEAYKWLPALLEAQLPTQVAKKYADRG